MFKAIAISTSRAKRKAKSQAGNNPDMPKVSRKTFVTWSKREQLQYLKAYPESSHKSLLHGDAMPRVGKETFNSWSRRKQLKYLKVYPKSPHKDRVHADTTVKEKKKPGRKKQYKDFPKKITREQFDTMDDKQQKAYLKKYPKNSFSRKHFTDKKSPIKNKGEPPQDKDGVTSVDTMKAGSDEETKILQKKAQVKARLALKQEIKHGITASSVKALGRVVAADISTAVTNLKANKKQNVARIMQTMDDLTSFIPFRKKDVQGFHANLQRIKGDENTKFDDDDIEKADALAAKVKEGVHNLTDDEYELYVKIKSNDPTAEVSSDEDIENILDEDGEEEENTPKKKPAFWRRDLDNMRKIFKGEKLTHTEKSNAAVLGITVFKYAMMATAVAALAAGAGPGAFAMFEYVKDSWGDWSDVTWGSEAGDKEMSDSAVVGHLYDNLVSYMQYMDVDVFKEDVQARFGTMFEGTSSASKISYRCLPDERHLGMEEKTQWLVYKNGDHIGSIYVEDANQKNASPLTRCWKAVLFELAFNPMEFPHFSVEDLQDINEPYVLVDEDPTVDNDLELHHPSLMSLSEARSWIRSIVRG